MKTLIVTLLAIGPLFAQDANVIELSKADADKAKAAYAALQKAQAEWDAIKARVAETYTIATREDRSITVVDGKSLKTAWSGGFDFDNTFKFIVPKTLFAADGSKWGCYTIQASPVTSTFFDYHDPIKSSGDIQFSGPATTGGFTLP